MSIFVVENIWSEWNQIKVMIYIKRLTGAMVKTTISIFKKEIKRPKTSIENNMINKMHRSL